MNLVDIAFTNFELILLALFAFVLMLQLLIILQIGSFKGQMREMQRNQELVTKHINSFRQGGNKELADKNLS